MLSKERRPEGPPARMRDDEDEEEDSWLLN
jgi:hypothetical protein